MNKEIAFARFIAAHELTSEELKDTEYLENLYANFKEECEY